MTPEMKFKTKMYGYFEIESEMYPEVGHPINEYDWDIDDLESERKIKKKWYKKGLLNIFSTSEKSGKSRWTWSNGPSSWVNK